jgi:type IV pilus assembly protein PilC
MARKPGLHGRNTATWTRSAGGKEIMSPVIKTTTAAAAPSTSNSVRPSLMQRSVSQKVALAGTKQGKRHVPGSKAIVNKELPAFSRQLSAMLSAGMPIVTSLTALHEQIANQSFKTVVGQVRLSIENGSAFSDALKAFPSVFNDLYVNMIRGGESGGQLAETIGRIADFLESTAKLRRKVKSAMSYPVAVMGIALALATLMIIFIVPVFQDMFKSFGGNLPAPTQALVNVSDAVRGYWWIVIPSVVALVFAFRKWKETTSGQFVLARLYLKMPIVGALVQKVAMARFARTFAQLIHSGVPILAALDITAGATGNKVVEKAVREGLITVEKGEPLSACLATKRCFTPILVHMLAAGEKTGKVDEMMDNIATFYEDEVDGMLSSLTSLLEPLLMVFLGVTIGGIVVCMFLPIFKLPELVSK